MDLSSILSKLNPQQREAVEHTEGPVLILAGAGSGKTRVITTRIAYLLGEGLCEPGQILGLTFTNKAAGEMRERAGALVGRDKAKEVVLSTFHSFCVRILRKEIEHIGYRRNFTISTEGDVRTLVRRALLDIDGGDETFDPDMFIERIGMVKSAGIEGEEQLARDPRAFFEAEPQENKAETQHKYRTWLPEVYERYQSALRAANTVDFDDLLLLTLRLWKEHPAVLAHYQDQFRYIMVDEYQDTNRVQYGMLMELAKARHNLCVVGDDDQSIYGWRGADIANILNFEKDYPEAKIVKLEQNYRSTNLILEAANRVIAHNLKRREKRLWSASGDGRRPCHIITANEEEEAKEAVEWLKHIQGSSGAKHNDFAILYRSNLQSRAFEVAFRQAQIPYNVVGGQDFFERAEIRDIAAYLKVIANPRDEASFLRIVNVPRRRIGDATLHHAHDLCRQQKLSIGKALHQLLDDPRVQPATCDGIREILGLLTEFRAQFRGCAGKLSLTASALLDRIDYRGELFRNCKSKEAFEARWRNVEIFLDALTEYETKTTSPTLAQFLDESALAGDDAKWSREERRQNGVTFMTVHSAKGLEFPFVFIVGVEEGSMPHEKSPTPKGIEEERRLFYVALTRAQRHVTLFEALSRVRFGKRKMTKPSRFLAEIPDGLLKVHVKASREMMEMETESDKPKAKPKKRPPRRLGG